MSVKNPERKGGNGGGGAGGAGGGRFFGLKDKVVYSDTCELVSFSSPGVMEVGVEANDIVPC